MDPPSFAGCRHASSHHPAAALGAADAPLPAPTDCPLPSAMVFGLFSTALWCRCLMVGAHALLARHLLAVAAGVDTTSGPSLTAAYMALWRLFYAEYMLVPFFGR